MDKIPYPIGGVYKLFWGNCNYFYIGSAKNFQYRLDTHLSKLRLGIHNNKRLQSVFNDFGEPELYIIAYCDFPNTYLVERSILNYYSYDLDHCCNINLHLQNGKNKRLINNHFNTR